MNYYLTRFIICTANILACLTLTCCTFFEPSNDAESLKLPLTLPEIWPEDWKISQLDDEPYLYKISDQSSGSDFNPAYFISLSECGVGKSASADATTRQLMVGLRDISIKRELKFNYNDGRVFYKESAARLDEDEIMLATFTRREGRCVYDTVIWSDDYRHGSVLSWFTKATPEQLQRIYFAFNYREK